MHSFLLTGTEVDCHVLFPEAELTIDAEDLSVESTEESCQLPESSQADASNASAQYSNEELEQIARQETEDDKQFQKFKKRVAHEPDQVQYNFGSSILFCTNCCWKCTVLLTCILKKALRIKV